ncbi:hypothetical protein JCM9279_004931 [Rhodotorula babjevae]
MTTEDLVAQPTDLLALENNNSVLFKLPTELIEYILVLAYLHPTPDQPNSWSPAKIAAGQPAHLPICRRLWPLQQRVRYRHIEINSFTALYCLGELITADASKPRDPDQPQPRLGSLVHHLRLNLYNDYEPVDESDHTRAPACLAQPFSSLDSLRSLDLDESRENEVESTLFDLVLHDPSTPFKLSALKALSICALAGPIEDGNAGDPAAWVRQLGQFSNLDTLELNFDTSYYPRDEDGTLGREYWPPSVFVDPTSLALPVLGNLSSFTVTSAFENWTTPLRNIMPNLERLKVIECDDSVETVIESAPPGLVSPDVALYSSSSVVDTPSVALKAILQLLPTFPHLRRLRLRAYGYVGTCTPSPFHVLPHLEVLELDGDFSLSDAVLLSIVDAPMHFQHLREVSLSSRMAGVVGPTLKSKGRLPGKHEHDGLCMWKGWVPPAWREGCSRAGYAAAVERGRARGVTLGGTVVKALDWWHEFDEEVRRIAVARGEQLGAWALARVVFGDEEVDSFIAQRQAAAT